MPMAAWTVAAVLLAISFPDLVLSSYNFILLYFEFSEMLHGKQTGIWKYADSVCGVLLKDEEIVFPDLTTNFQLLHLLL